MHFTHRGSAVRSALLGLIAMTLSGGMPPHVPPEAAEQPSALKADVRSTLTQLLADEDTDNDLKITIDDPHVKGTDRGDKNFWIVTRTGRYEISGTYYLSNLLQELKQADDEHKDSVILDPGKIFEPPVKRISRMIRDFYWTGLTRRMEGEGLAKILQDEKTATVDNFRYIYVPGDDTLTLHFYARYAEAHPDLRIKVVQLPEDVTPGYVRKLDGYHGILALSLARSADGTISAEPFVVPGGRFNEMYGWDSYFIVLGLLHDGQTEMARSIVDNFMYEIEHYGKVLNANRTYYLTRSQPPFFTSMIREVYERLPRNAASKSWLARGVNDAIREYQSVWMNKDHLTEIGLSRYFDDGYGPPPEVEPGHFNALFARFAKRYSMDAASFEKAYRSGSLKVPELDEYFVSDRAMRESGHDTSYRLIGLCAELATVDLNSLLYKVETDLAAIIRHEFNGSFTTASGSIEKFDEWLKKARTRKDLINKYCWNASKGMYFDYDVKKQQQTDFVSAATFYPLWAKAASQEQADQLVKQALPALESAGGITGSTEQSRGPITPEHPATQWDYPNGWAPHQILIWKGMQNYGHSDVAARLAYKWLFTMTSNAVNFNGTVTEKYDVVSRSHQVFAEYGNVGTKFSYITREGFGWTNASYELGLGLLPADRRNDLDRLIGPEWIFPMTEH
jgi:alpha,alpha-trehalase